MSILFFERNLFARIDCGICESLYNKRKLHEEEV